MDNTNEDGTFKYGTSDLYCCHCKLLKQFHHRDGMVFFMSDESAVSLSMPGNGQNSREYIVVEDVRPRDFVLTQAISQQKVRS